LWEVSSAKVISAIGCSGEGDEVQFDMILIKKKVFFYEMQMAFNEVCNVV
jgi:hypothetical protein